MKHRASSFRQASLLPKSAASQDAYHRGRSPMPPFLSCRLSKAGQFMPALIVFPRGFSSQKCCLCSTAFLSPAACIYPCILTNSCTGLQISMLDDRIPSFLYRQCSVCIPGQIWGSHKFLSEATRIHNQTFDCRRYSWILHEFDRGSSAIEVI